jgi:hypothetical protein
VIKIGTGIKEKLSSSEKVLPFKILSVSLINYSFNRIKSKKVNIGTECLIFL